jgi:hypothetical protein
MGFPRTLMLAALALSAVAAPGVATTASAQTPPTDTSIKPASTAYRYRVLGVFDDVTGDPLEGVEVSDILTGNKSLTTSTGTVSLLFLPDGGGFIRLRKVGYELQTMPVAIAPSELTPVTVVLRRATMLEKVVVTDSAAHHVSPGLRQFEEHRRNGTGQYIAQADLRKQDTKSLASVFSGKFNGVQSMAGRAGASYLVSSRKQCSGPALRQCTRPDCYVTVYLDGVRLFDNTMGSGVLPDFSRMNASDFSAAEFYPGGEALPAGFSPTNADCGTLLLWSRTDS